MNDGLQAHLPENVSDTIKIPLRVKSGAMPINNPHRLAKSFIARRRDDQGELCIVLYRGKYYVHKDGHWSEITKPNLLRVLTAEINDEFDSAWRPPDRLAPGGDGPILGVTRNLVNDVLNAIDSLLPPLDDLEPPFWVSPRTDDPDPSKLLCTPREIVRLDSRHVGESMKGTPRLFSLNGLDFDVAGPNDLPESWIGFLESIWGDDLDSIRELQKWFGYCLTDDTSQQKMLCLVGPTRSGKGTIAHAMEMIVGRERLAGLNYKGLCSHFGLQKAIGKRLAIIGDDRSTWDDPLAVERLLGLVGEDPLDADAKYGEPRTIVFKLRIALVSNQVPAFNDPGNALAARLHVLRLTESFLGREDTTLRRKIEAERSGILAWALQGLKMLHDDGKFNPTASSEAIVAKVRENSDTVEMFARERIRKQKGHREIKKRVLDAYEEYCRDLDLSPVSQKMLGERLIALGYTGKGCQQNDAEGKKRWCYGDIVLLGSS